MRSLSIIIPNYNGEILLSEYLPNIIETAKEYKGDWEIIIADDQSKDNSIEVVKKLKGEEARVRIVINPVNLGFSGTCNMGMKAAKGEILFLLNNDVKLEKEFFHYFNSYFDNPSTFAVSVTGYRMKNGKLLDGSKFFTWKRGMPRINVNKYEVDFIDRGFQRPYPCQAVQGAYFFADSKKMNALGGFDELFSPYNFEETDLSYRALKRGWKIWYEPRCIAHHAVNATIGKKKKRRVKVITVRNKLFFVWKNIHDRSLLANHFLVLFFRIITFNLSYWRGLRMALYHIKTIRDKRRVEKKEAILKDKEIINIRYEPQQFNTI